MRFSDYLGSFSIDDLRETALRRGVILSQGALRDRQTLVRTLSSALERYESLYPALNGLNCAEQLALRYLLQAKRPSLSALARETGADPAAVRTAFEGLRLRALAFPEGDWEHIVVPSQTRMAQHYMPVGVRPGGPAALPGGGFTPPELRETAAETHPRTGSISRDLAEFLARVARSRFRLTQSGRVNRRDLRSMETAFGVSTYGYAVFLYLLAAGLGTLAAADGILATHEWADGWLAQPEAARAAQALSAWRTMGGYPESAMGDPAELEYIPLVLPIQRMRAAELLRGLEPGKTFSVGSLSARLAWLAPLTFQQWDTDRDADRVASRLVRSLYWLGLVDVDDPDAPTAARLTPLGAHVSGGEQAAPALVPEEPEFFLQPNAEVFAPPNLAPRTLFHLRRITGEKKGGAAGMYPINPDSVRRALDSGLTTAQLLPFLERFSRTGLPDSVRHLVETVGRQHGRIRLIPTGYVLVVDDPVLMQELNSARPIAPLLGREVTGSVRAVDAAAVPELLRKLRARGYAPVDEGEAVAGVPLPEAPAAPAHSEPPPAVRVSAALDWSSIPEAAPPGAPPGETVTGVEAIRSLIEQAADEGLEVEIEYQGSGARDTLCRVIWPWFVSHSNVEAYCRLREDDRDFKLSRIRWARLTGERFAVEG